MYLLLGVGVALVCAVIGACWKYNGQTKEKRTAASIMIVIGSGGHTTEMLQLVKSLDHRYHPRIYLVAVTDCVSEKKILALEDDRNQNLDPNKPETQYTIIKIPRARELHQSWLTTIVTTLKSCLCSVPIVLKWKPDIILCNGPGTCIPVCFVGILLKIGKIVSTKIIYVESICRVHSLSLSGKLLYPFADHLLVQWPELSEKYQKAVYLGRLSG